ncbi:hypothetical protein [Mycoplasma sp. Sp33II]|uniref:hypothetical protein n=1 Tax=unclassified Mycoplasma TaxID=2683645 RepID=UPI003AAA356D
MTKIKKLLLSFTLTSTAVALPITAVACNNSADSSKSISKEMKTVFDEMAKKMQAHPENAMQISQEMQQKLMDIAQRASKLSLEEQQKIAKEMQEYMNALIQKALGHK